MRVWRKLAGVREGKSAKPRDQSQPASGSLQAWIPARRNSATDTAYMYHIYTLYEDECEVNPVRRSRQNHGPRRRPGTTVHRPGIE